MKILYSWSHRGMWIESIRLELNVLRKAGYAITDLNHGEISGVGDVVKPAQLEKMYQEKHAGLMRLYAMVRDLAETCDVLMVNYGNLYHPEFVQSLRGKIYTVLVSGDDPNASDVCSKPYVASFDHCFAWGVYFDEKTRITDRFKEWGARRADWWPYGVRPDAYDPWLTAEDIHNEARDIDVLFVGGAFMKEERLLQLKRHFRGRFRIYGSWGRRFLWKRFIWPRSVPRDGLVPLYRRAKIGINMHLTYGPSNLRTYELPANGVMQVCDCYDGVGEIFEIGKEIVPYRSMKEAIEAIEYYLEHDAERKKIAANGFRRIMKDYTRVTTFARALSKIQEGMLAENISFYKDGSRVAASLTSVTS